MTTKKILLHFSFDGFTTPFLSYSKMWQGVPLLAFAGYQKRNVALHHFFPGTGSRQIYVQAHLLDSLPAETSARKNGTANPAAAAPQKNSRSCVRPSA